MLHLHLCWDVEDLCFDLIDHHPLGVTVELVIAVYSFVGIAATADGPLAQSLETLCQRWRVPEDVAGASFMAFGGSAPEIIVAAVSTMKASVAMQGHHRTALDAEAHSAYATSLGISSVVGSGMLAFTLIPGLCALVVPRTLRLKRRPVVRDAAGYLLSLALLHRCVLRGHASFGAALQMLVLYGGYLAVTAVAPRLRESYRASGLSERWSRKSAELGEALAPEAAEEEEGSGKAGAAEAEAEDQAGEEAEAPPGACGRLLALPFRPLLALLRASCPDCELGGEGEPLYPLTLTVAFAWLSVFSFALSAAVTRWGTLLNLPPSVMGVYVIAVGAQVPDTLQAVAVARRGLGSMAVASAVGSQVINVLVGLGLPWLLSSSAGREVAIKGRSELIDAIWLMRAPTAPPTHRPSRSHTPTPHAAPPQVRSGARLPRRPHRPHRPELVQPRPRAPRPRARQAAHRLLRRPRRAPRRPRPDVRRLVSSGGVGERWLGFGRGGARTRNLFRIFSPGLDGFFAAS